MKLKHKLLITFIIALVLTAVLIPLTGCKDSPGAGGSGDNTLSEIYIAKSDMPRLNYVQGQELDLSSGKLTAIVGGNETKLPLTAPEVTITGYDKNTVGEQTLTVTYSGLTATFKVTVVERAVAEKFETKYFIGDKFKADMGKIKITTDDAKSFSVNMSDEKVSVVTFDSSQAGTTTVTLLYSDGTNSYYCQFDVMIYDKSNVEFTAPAKTDYLSHDNTLNISGGYFTVTSSDSTLTMNVPLTVDMITGFDPSAATIENRKTPLEQTLTVTYLDKTFNYTISIQFSGISAINYYVNESLSKIDWTNAKENGLSEQERDAAFAAINEYYDLSDAQKALLSDEIKTTVGRAASVAAQKLFLEEIATYSDSFKLSTDGSVYFSNSTCEKVAADVKRFNEPDADLNAYAQLLRKIEAEFGDAILVDEIKVSDLITVYTEDVEVRFKEVLNHLVNVFGLVKDIPTDWNAESLKPFGDDLLSAAMQIYTAEYYKNGYSTYYTKILSPWREKNDVFDILYTYFLYDYEDGNGKDFLLNYMWGAMPMPGTLEVWYVGLNEAAKYSNYYKNYGSSSAFLSDLTTYMYNYFYTLEICEEIKNSGNQLWIDIYNIYNGDYMNRTYMYTYSYGYLALTNAMIDSEAYHELWEKYYDVLKFYYADNLSYEANKAELMAMFNAFEDLTPTELLGFLSSLNLMYTNAKGQYPMLGHTKPEGDEKGKVYNVFSYILSNGYSKYFNENNAVLFNDLLSAMESFVLIGYKDNALEKFNEKMAALSEAVEALSETDRANFMEYCGKSYDKYFSLYELTSGKVKVELTDEEKALFDELHTTVKQYFIVYANIYSIVQQGNKVSDDAYPILYALYARVSTIRNNILATARPEAILMLYTAEYDINTVMYSLEKAYYLADNITSSLLTSMTAMVSKGDGTVSYTTYWDLYTAYGFDKFLSDMCDILYASYFTDGKTIDHAMLLSAMAKYREFTTFETSIFTLMNIDDTFYRSLNVYYKSVLTEGGLEFSQSLVEAERAYLLYTLSTSNEENRTAFITAMEAVISDYENLSAEDKAYLDDMYNYYVKILEDVKKDTEAVA